MTLSKPLPWPFVLILFIIGLLECGYLINELARPLLTKPDPVYVWKPVTDPRFIAPVRFRAWIRQDAAEFGIPQDIAVRLGFEESAWIEGLVNRNRNGTYDHNIYQTNSRYFKVKLTREHIHDSMEHLAWCWKVTGNLRKAIIAWNAGLSRVKKPPLKSVQLADRVVSGQL